MRNPFKRRKKPRLAFLGSETDNAKANRLAEQAERKRKKEKEKEGQTPLACISRQELERAKPMAKRLAGNESFARFCADKKLGSPEKAFLRFYESVSSNQKLWKLENEAEERAEKQGKKFSRTGFYGKLFIKCEGNPVNLTSLLFKVSH